jgi:very-short-patch-repair endonuclease
LKLAIELDGDSHFIGNGPTYDAARQKYIVKDGIKIMRFTNTDINENIEGVIFLIQQATMGK